MLKVLEEDTKLRAPRVKDENIAIYLPREGWGIVAEDMPVEEKRKDYRGKEWMHEFLEYSNAVTFKDVSKKQGEFVLWLDYFSLNELIDVKPKEGSSFIYSASEPHDEEQAIDFERMMNWVRHFRLKYYEAHASGHANMNELKWIVNEIKPKKVIPIHTTHAEVFKRIVKDGIKVEIVG